MHEFFNNNLDIVYFVYGLAFFTMGVIIFAQPVWESKFKLLGILRFLGWFGVLHGMNEWLDGWAVVKGHSPALDVARLAFLSASYAFLFEFGRRLIRLDRHKYPDLLKKAADALTWLLTPAIVITILILSGISDGLWQAGFAWIRYFVGVPGGILIGCGFFLYYKYEKENMSSLGVKKYFISASVSFLVYGLLAGFVVSKGSNLLSQWINAESFLEFTNIPIQVFRCVCAMIAGWSAIGILKIFNLEKITKLQDEMSAHKQSDLEREKLNVELLKVNERLMQLALEDSHTELYNHRYLVDIVEVELARAKRNFRPLSVLMMDLDYFKSINDVYGHPFGDLVLKQFAKLLKNTVRLYDVVARFGGEEFVIVSPDTPQESAIILGQRLLEATNLAEFGNDEHKVKLKVSIAVASFPIDLAHSGMDLVEIADQILGKVKQQGGNRVYCSEDININKGFMSGKTQEASDVNELKETIVKLTRRANQSIIEATAAFAKTIEVKDHYTGEHVERTVTYSVQLARALNLSEKEIEDIKQAAVIHDLGKIGIDETILSKTSKLTEDEFEKIKQHPQIGIDIIRPIQFLHPIIPLILYHHERWDGKGYPMGLKGPEIPLGARLIAIADVYQALTSNRPYRKAYSQSEALKIIKDGTGTQFDPRIAHVFIEIVQNEKTLDGNL